MDQSQERSSRGGFLGDDAGSSLLAFAAGATVFVAHFALEYSYATTSQPALDFDGVLVPMLVLPGSVVTLYGALTREWNPIVRGGVVGVAAFAAYLSTVIALRVTGLLGDDLVGGGTVVVLLGVTALQAYANRGLLVCWYLVAAPVAAFFVPFFLLHGGAFAREYAAVAAVARALVFTLPVAFVVGSVGFLLGRAAERYRRSHGG